jgi:multicomponent Na+:H+ antiporter subunit G
MLGILVAGSAGRPVTTLLAMIFMLLTLSVASQLLARAAYLSGEPIEGLDRGDPLADVLDRTEVQEQVAEQGSAQRRA